MDRRELLTLLAGAAAAGGLSPAQLAALGRAKVPRRSRRAFFTSEQREAVSAVADAIIPRTNTPGAVDAGVVDFIELIVAEWYDQDDRERFMRGLSHLDQHAVALAGVRFAQAGEGRQAAILAGLQAEGRKLLENDEEAESFFHRIRGLTLQGYYTSEVGMTQELRWTVIPGRFDGCADLSEVTRQRSEGG